MAEAKQLCIRLENYDVRLAAKMKYLGKAITDCTFVVGKTPVDTKLVQSYKFILASVSPVFDRMFNGDFLEFHDPEGIEITDVEPVDFQMFLRMITYGQFPSAINPQIIYLNIYWLAKKYEIQPLMCEVLNPFLRYGKDFTWCVLVKALNISVDCRNSGLTATLKNQLNKKMASKTPRKSMWGSFIYDMEEDAFYEWLTCGHSDIEKFNLIDMYAKVHSLKPTESVVGR